VITTRSGVAGGATGITTSSSTSSWPFVSPLPRFVAPVWNTVNCPARSSTAAASLRSPPSPPAWLNSSTTAFRFADGTRWALRGPSPVILASSRPVTVGIRPDDLRLVGDGAGEVEGEVTGTVSVVEPLGNETLLSVMVAGQEMTARVDGLVSTSGSTTSAPTHHRPMTRTWGSTTWR
jgi:hypothetical protein